MSEAEELTKLRRQLAAAQSIIKAQEVLLSNAALLADKYREAIATLQSERDANAMLTAAVEELLADAERLDWLDSMNAALNERNGTVYGWRLILSPNIVRLLAEHHAEGRKGNIDLNDANARMPTSCRAAIDAARAKP